MNDDSNSLEGLKNCVRFKKLWNNNELELLSIKTLCDDRTLFFQFIDIALASDDSANTISSCEGNCERLEPDVTSDTCDLLSYVSILFMTVCKGLFTNRRSELISWALRDMVEDLEFSRSMIE